MVVTVVVTGLPRLMALKDLAVELNEFLDGEELGDFLIRDVVTNYKISKRQVALDFESGFDAMRVQEKLDGFEFETSGGSCNLIKAKIMIGTKEENLPSKEVVISTSSKQHCFEPQQEIDPFEAQIDLLRKKTLALKAERKFIREKKKLKKEYANLDIDSGGETSQPINILKRKRSNSKSSNSDSDDRSKSLEIHRPQVWSYKNRKSISKTGDYVAIEFKKVSTTRKTKSPETCNAARSKSREIQPRNLELYKRRSRSRSPYKFYADEYKKLSRFRKSKSPTLQSSRRVIRSRSYKKRSPESRNRRSRSRSREKYYSVETIQYKKSLVTRSRSPVSRSRYESTEPYLMRTQSSKHGRSPSPDIPLRHKIASRRRQTSRSRNRSNSPLDGIPGDTKALKIKNKSPSFEKIYSQTEYSSDVLDSKREKPKAKENAKSRDRDEPSESDAEIQSKKRQAIEDVLFEMELLLRKEKYTISNADKSFLTHLVNGIINSRFQKLEVHRGMMVSDVVTLYRSRYSKEEDKALLRNLAGECKSLDASTSIIGAESTAKGPVPETQNDEIWTAVDEVLDGVDLDLLQGDTENNEEEINRNSEKESQKNGETHTKCVVIEDAIQDAKVAKDKDQRTNQADLPENNSNNITSSGIAMTNPKMPVRINTIDLTEVSSEGLANCGQDGLSKSHANHNKVDKCVKIEPIELSDDSSNEMGNEQTNTGTGNQENRLKDNNACIGRKKAVRSVAQVDPKQNIVSVKKQKVATIDLTDDLESNDEQANTVSSDTHFVKDIKKERDNTDSTSNTNHFNPHQANDALTHTNLLTCIKKEKPDIYSISLTDDDEDDVRTTGIPIAITSIKKENMVEDVIHSESSRLSATNSIKQESETAANDSLSQSNTSEICGEYFPNKTLELKSVKQEHEIDDASCRAESSGSIFSNTVNPLDSSSKPKIKDLNNEKHNMPVPIIASSIKQEYVANNTAGEIADIDNDQINMPVPIVTICIKKEYDTSRPSQTINSIDKEQITPSLKKRDVATCFSNKSESINSNNDQMQMPIPFSHNTIKMENGVKTTNPSTHDARTDMNDDQSDIPMPVPIKPVKKENVSTDTSGSKKRESIDTKKQLVGTSETSLPKKHKSDEPSKPYETEKEAGRSKHKDNVESVTDKGIATVKKDTSHHEMVKIFSDIIPDKPGKTAVENSFCKTEEIPDISERTVPANPRFVVPTFVIMRPVIQLIKKQFKENKYIFYIARKVLKDRFKKLLKGKGYVQAKYIIKMYRERYGYEKFEDFLNRIAADISAGKYDEDIEIIEKEKQDKDEKKNNNNNNYVLATS